LLFPPSSLRHLVAFDLIERASLEADVNELGRIIEQFNVNSSDTSVQSSNLCDVTRLASICPSRGDIWIEILKDCLRHATANDCKGGFAVAD
jgi:hypothetical protein